MSRVQLALRVTDLEGSIDFYTKLLGAEPAKIRPGYANFAIADPPLKLVLTQADGDQPTTLDHLGVEVQTTEEVTAATARLQQAGLATREENDTTCCYALQDKVWVTGPGQEPWEVYVVKADVDPEPEPQTPEAAACCGTTACCTPDEQALDPNQSAVQAKTAAGCGCVN